MMSQQSVEQLRFSFLAQKPVVVQSRPQPISGDAGLLPIRQFDHGWGYSQRLAACLVDRRVDPSHSHEQMTRQRIYGILAGYADCNDHDALRSEPVFKLIAGRQPEDDPLASQPTLCRFEKRIAIDEISIGRGHRYFTVVLDLDSGAVVFIGEGKGAQSLDSFWKRLRASRAKVRAVATDMSPAYTLAVRENLLLGDGLDLLLVVRQLGQQHLTLKLRRRRGQLDIA